MFRNWKEKTTFGKALSVIGFIIALAIIVLALLDLFNVYDTIVIYESLLAVLMILQAIEQFKKDKKTAIVSIVAAILIGTIVLLHIF